MSTNHLRRRERWLERHYPSHPTLRPNRPPEEAEAVPPWTFPNTTHFARQPAPLSLTEDASRFDVAGTYRRFGFEAPDNTCPPINGFVCVHCDKKGFAGRTELTKHIGECPRRRRAGFR